MKINKNVVNRKDRQKGRLIIRWATTGMNYAKDKDLEAFVAKARQMLGNTAEECRVGKALRGLETITQSAAVAAIEG